MQYPQSCGGQIQLSVKTLALPSGTIKRISHAMMVAAPHSLDSRPCGTVLPSTSLSEKVGRSSFANVEEPTLSAGPLSPPKSRPPPSSTYVHDPYSLHGPQMLVNPPNVHRTSHNREEKPPSKCITNSDAGAIHTNPHSEAVLVGAAVPPDSEAPAAFDSATKRNSLTSNKGKNTGRKLKLKSESSVAPGSRPQKPTERPAPADCGHPKPWRRVRAKRGFTYYACHQCGVQWRLSDPAAWAGGAACLE